MKRSLAILITLTLSPILLVPQPASAMERPNILVFVVDDMRAGGANYTVMPEMRRIFGIEGVRFPKGFTTTPTCCPARASIFSGKYAHNTGVKKNFMGGELDLSQTIQAVLKGEGYQTALSGKYLNEIDTAPPFFDYYAKMSGLAGKGNFPGYYDVPFLVGNSLTGNTGETTVSQYSTTYIGEQATGFLDTFEASDETPWYMYVAPLAPHRPFQPEAKLQVSPHSRLPRERCLQRD